MNRRELTLNRFIAKGVDFFIVAFLWTLLSYIEAPFLGMLAGMGYLLIADGFFEGQSLGKKLVKLRVVVSRGDVVSKCRFKNSIIRNSLFAVIIFSSIPLIGWLIFLLFGIPIIAIEAYFAYTDEQRRRIGDVLAGTVVQGISGEPIHTD